MIGATYSYRDADGRLLYQVVRHVPKAFNLLDAHGEPLDEFPAQTVLYRLPELLAADKKAVVYFTEGEKDSDRLASLGLVATTNPGGCHLGWKPEYVGALTRRHVIVLADNDRPGARHAERVEMALRGTAASVAILKLPRLRRADDVSDWLDYRKGTRDELLNHVRRLVHPGQVSLAKSAVKGHAKRHAIFLSLTLTSAERLLLLAIQHHSGETTPLTATELASCTGLHRVTVQRLITALNKRGLLTRNNGRLEICWEHVL